MASKRGIGDIQNEAIQKMSERFAVTWLGTNNPGKRFDENPNFDVYEFSADKKLDDGERDYLWGPDGSIVQQASTVKALHDSLSRRFGFNIKFEEFWKFWEEGFKGFERKSKVASLKSNYPENDIKEGAKIIAPAWRTSSKKPAYIEWTPKGKTQFSLRIIEYFPDRSNNRISKLFIGSDWTIIRDIIQYEYEGKGGSETVSGSAMSSGGEVKRRGQPQVKLYFIESMADVDPDYAPVVGEIGFRLMNVSDDPASDKPKITEADIKTLANAIKAQFLSPTPYVWKKGKEMVSYSDWSMGYQLQILCRSKAVGIELAQKILSIQAHPYVPKRVKHSISEDEVGAYPTVPPEVTVLGRTVKTPRYRPVADVVFTQASLSLHYFPQDIVLVNDIGDILPNFASL